MKIIIEDRRISSFTGAYIRWTATCGRYKGNGTTAHKALSALNNLIADELEKKSKIKK